MTSWYSDTARQSQVTHVANYRQVGSALHQEWRASSLKGQNKQNGVFLPATDGLKSWIVEKTKRNPAGIMKFLAMLGTWLCWILLFVFFSVSFFHHRTVEPVKSFHYICKQQLISSSSHYFLLLFYIRNNSHICQSVTLAWTFGIWLPASNSVNVSASFTSNFKLTSLNGKILIPLGSCWSNSSILFPPALCIQWNLWKR